MAFQTRPRLQSKRAAAQRIVAATTPVATVEKTLEKTASKIAEGAEKAVEKVVGSEKPDLGKAILLQGARRGQLLLGSPSSDLSIATPLNSQQGKLCFQ